MFNRVQQTVPDDRAICAISDGRVGALSSFWKEPLGVGEQIAFGLFARSTIPVDLCPRFQAVVVVHSLLFLCR